jgi:diguanylate cyclase (GGDEF)-like protein
MRLPLARVVALGLPAAFFAAVVIGERFRLGGSLGVHIWADSGWTLAGALATAACAWRATRSRGNDRRVWIFFAAGCGAWLLGQCAWDWYELGTGTFPPSPTLADIGYLGFVLPFLAGMMTIVQGSGRRLLLLALDMATAFVAFVMIYVALFYSNVSHSALNSAGVTTVILYPVLYSTLAFAFLLVPLRAVWKNRSVTLLLIGCFCQVVPFILWTPLDLSNTFQEGSILDVIWMAGLLAIAVSALQFTEFPTVDAERQVFGRSGVLPLGLLLTALVIGLVGHSVSPLPAGIEMIFLRRLGFGLVLVGLRVALTIHIGKAILWRERESRRTLARTQDSLRHQALHDALTGLPNRVLFGDRLEQCILGSHRDQTPASLLLLDLDGFKEVNDTLGHAHGDALLREVAGRLRSTLRESDTVARLGGDEFALLLPHTDGRGALHAASKVRRALQQPFALDDQMLELDASIGVVVTPEHGADPDALLRRADIAMYAAKRNRSGAALYSADQDQYTTDRLRLVGDLREAIAAGSLEVYFQPQLDPWSGEITGVEALLRWQHPVHGFVPPDRFVNLAEQHGLIEKLTLFVLNAALAQARRWRDHGIDLAVSVNLSPQSLRDARLVRTIGALLKRHHLPPESLVLEITENAVMANPEKALANLSALHDAGILLSIDDFGTGYSSLGYLRRLPLHEIKIDRSFVTDLCRNDDDRFIVRTVVDLGRNLGLRIVAEGVEDEQTLNLVATLGCTLVQGYHTGRPMPAAELEAFLQSRQPDRARAS